METKMIVPAACTFVLWMIGSTMDTGLTQCGLVITLEMVSDEDGKRDRIISKTIYPLSKYNDSFVLYR